MPQASNFMPPTSKFVPPTSAFIPPTSAFIPHPASGFVPPTSTSIPQASIFVPPTSAPLDASSVAPQSFPVLATSETQAATAVSWAEPSVVAGVELSQLPPLQRQLFLRIHQRQKDADAAAHQTDTSTSSDSPMPPSQPLLPPGRAPASAAVDFQFTIGCFHAVGWAVQEGRPAYKH